MRSIRLGMLGLAISLLAAVSSPPARADVVNGDIYDGVDSVTVLVEAIEITGVLHGASTPTSKHYFLSDAVAARCDRLALVMITKPGKYQFAVAGNQGCQLIVRNP
jgi:hypothetical protein